MSCPQTLPQCALVSMNRSFANHTVRYDWLYFLIGASTACCNLRRRILRCRTRRGPASRARMAGGTARRTSPRAKVFPNFTIPPPFSRLPSIGPSSSSYQGRISLWTLLTSPYSSQGPFDRPSRHGSQGRSSHLSSHTLPEMQSPQSLRSFCL